MNLNTYFFRKKKTFLKVFATCQMRQNRQNKIFSYNLQAVPVS